MLVAALGCAAGAGCPRGEAPAPTSTAGERCFEGLAVDAPGQVRLLGPIACGAGGARVRAVGPAERPTLVTQVDVDGQAAMSIRIERDAGGRPRLEERTLLAPARPLRVWDRGQRFEFATPGAEARLPVRVRTELDELGRPVRTEKRVGERLEFVVTRTFGPEGLEREVTADPSGKVRLERRFGTQDGRRIERMLDGEGRLLLEREAPDPGVDAALDKPGETPVQVPPSRQE